jgi:endonuclease III
MNMPTTERMSVNTKAERAEKIRGILKAVYPHVKTQLDHESPFQLLAATILSAQCTDRQVNRVTPALFTALPTPAAMAAAPLEQIEALVYTTGFYRNKARNLKACARMLVEAYGGQVPEAMADLTRLPGVGRKTANVVRAAAFGQPGMVVDTHVARIARRLALTDQTDPVRIETDLMALLPESAWRDFSLRLVYFGREYCRARQPRCPDCPMEHWCPWPDKVTASGPTK